jgi:release factor glutamine methyltransferase
MTVTDLRAPARRRVLPAGANGSLWSARPSYGLLDFRDRRLRIEVADPSEVLFPTDCGLSLLAALQADDAPALAGTTALDIGCGSGLYTVALLAAGAEHVTALDINPASAGATVANVIHNGLDLARLACVTSDLAYYRPDKRFDLVVTNPPHLPYDPEYATHDGLETALVAGRNGRALYDVIVGRMDDLLAPGGTLLMAHSSLTDVARTTAELEQRGYSGRTLEVCEMDIPLLAYAEHKDTMLGHLERLRASGSAVFDGERFSVHVMAFRRGTNQPDR